MFNKKILAIGLLSGTVLLASLTSMQQGPQQQGPQQQGPQQPVKYTNLKVLPKSIKKADLDRVMREWSSSLGVRCNFCHDNASKSVDTKPEKEMARKMYVMEGKINKKYFGAKKDSLGMMAHTGINCNTCHKGTAHPKVVLAAAAAGGQGGFGGPGQVGPNGQGMPARQQNMAPGTTPPAGQPAAAPRTNR